ncbi:MAG: hypothetical protein EXR75_03125 [Myxococcales bacterium]|nr:hypothetical protein [Myxococcales bacterium]
MSLRMPSVRAPLTALSLALLASAAAVGCSTTETTPAAVDGAHKLPPSEPADGKDGDGSGYIYAVNKLFLGETDRKGSPKSDAWEEYGFDLDNKISTKTSTDLCKPRPGAIPASVRVDGKGGVDNSFGKNLIPIIASLAQNPSATINENILAGDFTIITRIDKLGTGADYRNLSSLLYVGANLGKPAAFDGTDEWPISPALLADPTDIDSSLVKFPKSYVNANTWVSGTPTPLDLTIAVAGFSLTLKISKALVVMDLAADRKSTSLGVIAGVIPVEELIAELKKVAGAFSAELCTGNTFESIAEQIRQASDILDDGTQDPTKECNAISIGLGFESKSIKLGPVAPASPLPPDPCSEGAGGADATTGSGGADATTGSGGAGGGT